MTQANFGLPIALAAGLVTIPAFAGPPVDPAGQGAVAAGPVYECIINGRSERFAIAAGGLADGSGSVTMLSDGVYAISRNGISYILDDTGIQVSSGPDAGKWECEEAASPVATVDSVPDAGALVRIAELEASLLSANTARELAEGERDTAIAALSASDAAIGDLEMQLRESESAMADGSDNAASLEAELEVATAALAAAEATIEGLEGQVAGLSAELHAEQDRAAQSASALNDALSRIGELLAERADTEAALAAEAETDDGGEMNETPAEDAAMETDAPADEGEATMDEAAEMEEAEPEMADAPAEITVETFDADAALLAIEAAELSPISRAALTAAIEQARNDPTLIGEVVSRLHNAMGQ